MTPLMSILSGLLLADLSRLWQADLWYAVPAIIAISLVYAATRHEQMQPILIHAGRMALWIAGFMLVVFAVLELISWQIS
jgi:cytochrome c oxidase assembly factor CtaG